MTSFATDRDTATNSTWLRIAGNTFMQVDVVKFSPVTDNPESLGDYLSILPDFLLGRINEFLVGFDGFEGAYKKWTEHEEVSGVSILGPSNLRSIKTKNYMQLVGDYRNNNNKWAHQILYALWWLVWLVYARWRPV